MGSILILNLIQEPLFLISFLFAIVIGLTFHEYSHALVATKLGDYTAKYNGRLTLNPSKHFDLLGTIFLLLFGFGWAKPVPINPNAFKGKYDELKVALAGPVSNVLIAIIFTIPYQFIIRFLDWESMNYLITILKMLEIIIGLNLALAVFNLIPINPLDGSHILKALLPRKSQDSWEAIERQISSFLMVILVISVFTPLNFLFFIPWIVKGLDFVISTGIGDVFEAIKFILHLFIK